MKEYIRLMSGQFDFMNNDDYRKANRYIRVTWAVLLVVWFALLITVSVIKL